MSLYLTWCLKFSLETFVNLLFCFSRLCALGIEPQKMFIEKKIVNELPIETQFKVNACYQKMPYHFRGLKI